MTHIGFTGTREGLSPRQEVSLRAILETFISGDRVYFHHGDCIGADAKAHTVFCDLVSWDRVILHPPLETRSLSFCQAVMSHRPKAYLTRDREIAASCGVLVACPKEHREVVRSGTWATVRYARAAGKTVVILWP